MSAHYTHCIIRPRSQNAVNIRCPWPSLSKEIGRYIPPDVLTSTPQYDRVWSSSDQALARR